MKTLKKTILLIIAFFSFVVANAQEFGDNACENYTILVKSAENNFKSITENTEGNWIQGENGRYITSRDFKITGMDGYLVIEPGNKHIYIINKKEENKVNKKEKINAYVSFLEKCLNVKPTTLILNEIKRNRFVVKNIDKNYTITFDVMGKDDDDGIITYIFKTDL